MGGSKGDGGIVGGMGEGEGVDEAEGFAFPGALSRRFGGFWSHPRFWGPEGGGTQQNPGKMLLLRSWHRRTVTLQRQARGAAQRVSVRSARPAWAVPGTD